MRIYISNRIRHINICICAYQIGRIAAYDIILFEGDIAIGIIFILSRRTVLIVCFRCQLVQAVISIAKVKRVLLIYAGNIVVRVIFVVIIRKICIAERLMDPVHNICGRVILSTVFIGVL